MLSNYKCYGSVNCGSDELTEIAWRRSFCKQFIIISGLYMFFLLILIILKHKTCAIVLYPISHIPYYVWQHWALVFYFINTRFNNRFGNAEPKERTKDSGQINHILNGFCESEKALVKLFNAYHYRHTIIIIIIL